MKLPLYMKFVIAGIDCGIIAFFTWIWSFEVAEAYLAILQVGISFICLAGVLATWSLTND